MHVRSTYRLAALGLASALLLAGCGSSDDEAVIEDAAAQVEEQPEGEDDASEAADEVAEETGPHQLNSGWVAQLSTVPDVAWTDVEQSPAHLVLAPGVSLRVTQTAQLDELDPELSSEVDPAAPDGPTFPADGETFLLATIVSEDPRWETGDSRPAESEAQLRLAGSPAAGEAPLRLGSGERLQKTYLLSVPADAAPEDAVMEVVTGDATQALSLLDGTRVSSDVEAIYQAGTQVTVEGEGWSHVFDGWGSGTHEVNGQVTGAVITPYVKGWARPGQVFLGVDIDARDDTGVNEDITTIQLELADGGTVTPENDASSLVNRFDERTWFQVPADSEQITLHVHPKGKAGTKEIDFESPVEVTLTIE
ncbi:hypothetical protein [Ornithinimicrobium cavernae]|uniref:hypothetical protein n=1 Tax=Ornithinimicrobium cavernae TaxID=2666047 RepID=UPI000D68F21D|nr:hypothetical protein [Ornithinimicrobium cavernae]